MKKIKTYNEYHDSYITKLSFNEKNDLELSIELDSYLNSSGVETSTLIFYNVKNRSTIEETLKKIKGNSSHNRWIAEIVSFCRNSKKEYLIDTSPSPSIIIESSSFNEI